MILNNNPCIRCGKQRVDLKSYKKKVDNSTITYTDTVCPDPACQAIVETLLKIDHDKREQMVIEKEKQAQSRLDEKNNR